jgi:predicted dehydrogenase
MSAHILIVGAGAIGARHLQGLARVTQPLKVDVVDPSQSARVLAARLLAKVGGLKAGQTRYHADLSELPVPDLAIVATNARERRSVIADLLRLGARHLLLEKVLFTRMADYDVVEQMLAQHRAHAWVNCVRRAYPRAHVLAELIGGRPFHYRVDGEGWGLGCNLIHHLDELAMLSGRADIRLCHRALARQTVPAKRAGYVEFFGTITGSFGGDDILVATCGLGTPGDRVVTIR